jgi:hypothetical protein
MKAKTLMIVWHCKEPVFTLDFHPQCPGLLATGGADKDIKASSRTRLQVQPPTGIMQ